MQINIEKNLVEVTPESDVETQQLQQLWQTIVDCVKFNKHLVPVGEFIPPHSSIARFAIEDAKTGG